jgi:hypothetical protein
MRRQWAIPQAYVVIQPSVNHAHEALPFDHYVGGNMNRSFARAKTMLGFVLFLGFVSSAQAASSLTIVSEPGDVIGQGITKTYTSQSALFAANGNGESVTLGITTLSDTWYIVVAAPRGEKLVRRTYPLAERAAIRTGRAPGLDMGGNGRSCSQVWGTFTIRQVGYDSGGNVTMLDGIFVQRCGNATGPRLIAYLSYKSTPLSFSVVSAAGDPIGLGITKSYFGDTSDFALSGNTGSAQFAVTGQRDDWLASIQPPSGQALRIGTFSTHALHDSSHAGLNFVSSGHSCSDNNGTLAINNIQTDTAGNVIGLYAVFNITCVGSTAPFSGTIRYHL